VAPVAAACPGSPFGPATPVGPGGQQHPPELFMARL